MNLSEENKKNLLIAAIVMAVTFGLMFVGMPAVINKLSDKVVERLKANYTPGPYAPGIDPDKVDPNVFRDSNDNQTDPDDWN